MSLSHLRGVMGAGEPETLATMVAASQPASHVSFPVMVMEVAEPGKERT